MGVITNSLQLIGAFVTMVGLMHAYTRSAFGLSLWKLIMSKLRGRGPDQTITMTGIPSSEAFGRLSLSNQGAASFELDKSQPLQEQLFQLEIHVRKLYAIFPPITRKLDRMEHAIGDVRQHAETLAEQAAAEAKRHVEEELQNREAEQTRDVTLDLRIAIVGLAITVVGQVLAYWA